MPESSKRLLVIGAHADDETFGCGGSIALETTRGNSVTVCCLSGNPARHQELQTACGKLGAKVVAIEGPELAFTITETANTIIPVIQQIQPEVIISHSEFDYHPDHRIVHQAVLRAAEWAGHSTQYKELAWRPKRLLSMEINSLFPAPTIFVDITETMEKKEQAIRAYQSQLQKTNDFYLAFNVQKARLRGVQAGCEYAEAFREVIFPIHGPFYQPSPTRKSVF
ncbi:MAG: PIG-L deacetylase family protein [Candidatus Hodarchaeota archaeon]